MEKITIKQFSLGDYERVVDVWQAAGLHVRPGDDKASITRKLERDPELFLTACDGGEIVGTVMGAYDGRRGYIYHVAVLPAYQRRGIARRLILEVEKRLTALGCPKINLSVRPDNTAAISFYESLGFELQHLQMGKDCSISTKA